MEPKELETIEEFQEASEEWLKEHPDMTDADFEQRLAIFQAEADKETQEKIAELDSQLPLEERNARLKKPGEEILQGTPIRLSDLTPEEGIKDWVWENYLAVGHITLMSSLWKAGKSTLVRALLRSMKEGEEFAGQPTKKCNVLILSEETKNEWYENREFFNLDDADNVYLCIRAVKIKPNLKQWVQLVEELQEICVEKQISLVIIDTIATFMPIQNENDAGEWTPALVPLYAFTESEENRSAVLLVHHFRKAGGSEATASRGSGALPGFVSNIIEFTRVEGSNTKNTQRLIRTYGRFPDVIPEIVIEFDLNENKYITKGTKYEVSKSAKIERVLEVFKENKEALSCRDIVRLWDDTRFGDAPVIRSVQRYVDELVYKGILVIIKEEVVVRKKTAFYALKGGYIEQTTIALPPTHGTVVSSVKTSDSESESLSSVNGKSEARTDDTTVATGVDIETFEDIHSKG